MRLALVGVGQAGGKIVDSFVEYSDRTGRDFLTAATAINTARSDLLGLERVPQQRRTLVGGARVKGHGVGADNELGADLAEGSQEEILGALDDVPIGDVDAFLVVAALGGGTGSGAGPVIARTIGGVYNEPVYGLGVLPASNEGGIYSLNAARSFKTFVRHVDSLLVFDNDAWRRSGETVAGSYDTINREIARRFGTLFSAGEVAPGDDVGESVVDASEVINTLGSGGVSTVGYAAEEVERSRGFLSRFSDGSDLPDATDTSRITGLVRRATMGRLTLPCSVDSSERALLVVSGPQRHLSREGVEHARQWLEEETGSMDVRAGDYPVETGEMAAVVLLSGVSEVPRVRELQQLALEAQDTRAAKEERHRNELEDLLTDERDELDTLF